MHRVSFEKFRTSHSSPSHTFRFENTDLQLACFSSEKCFMVGKTEKIRSCERNCFLYFRNNSLSILKIMSKFSDALVLHLYFNDLENLKYESVGRMGIL